MQLTVGQAVHWKPAPGGIAQIEELRPRRVRLFYRTRKSGRVRRPLISVSRIRTAAVLTENLLGRAFIPRTRTYFLREGN